MDPAPPATISATPWGAGMTLDDPTRTFEPTRAAGEARMGDFAPRMGRARARGRNYDRGPGAQRDDPGLSL